jgi:hypothetical protein
MSTVHDRHQIPGWLRRQARRPAILGTGLVVTAALLTGGATALTAGPASADTTTSTQSFTQAGTYQVIVPSNVTTYSLAGLGGAGAAGQPPSDDVSTAGAGGSGSSVTLSFDNPRITVVPGDVLQIVVGAGGGGNIGGTGDGIAGNGGNGGGVTYVYNQTAGFYLLVAAGGGGGGGGSGLFPGYNGGRGGTDGPGSAGVGQFGGYIGLGGSEGTNCFATSGGPDEGFAGFDAPSASADGGGGGGGGGICGGFGGQGSSGSGDGGGGSGYSAWNPNASSSSLTSGSNTGDGSASVSFTVFSQAPAVTSAGCMYATSNGSGHFTAGRVTATGLPAPDVSVINPPSWLGLDSPVNFYPASGAATTSRLLKDLGTVADGQYEVAVEATNSLGTAIAPLSLAIEPGSAPAFVSDSSATATAGTPFDFAVRTASCPPIDVYSLTGLDIAIVGWLVINPNTGELVGTPTAAAVGTHHFTIIAQATGTTGSISQSFTLTVNPPPATAPGAPVIGTAAAGNAKATVNFTPPASDGGAAITTYTVTAADQTNAARGGQTATGTGSPVTVTGLTNGDSYTFTVTATNSAGTGPASSPSNAVTPEPPGRPSADLSVTLSPHATAAAGSTFTETVTVTNHGPWAATDVRTAVTVPGQLTVTDDPGGTKTGPVVRWVDASLGANDSVTYTITFKVAARARGTALIAAATASAKVADPKPFNNAAFITVKFR